MTNNLREEWRPARGFEGRYEVSDEGRVRSVPRTFTRIDGSSYTVRGRILRPTPGDHGRLQVGLYGPNGFKNCRVHTLVLEAFVGPRPKDMDGCHWDDDNQNNRLSNLRWDTKSANKLDAVRNGIHPEARKTHCKWGHEFTPENTAINGRGARCCLICRRRHSRGRTIRQDAHAS